jgi:hypothetical protein
MRRRIVQATVLDHPLILDNIGNARESIMHMDNRKALGDLTRSLRDLHQALVQVARREYERQWGAVDSAQLLQLLTRHPDFDWLHALSELMVDIDEMLDRDQPRSEDVGVVRDALEKMLAPGESAGSGFSTRYVAALQHDPALVIAHMGVRRILDTL